MQTAIPYIYSNYSLQKSHDVETLYKLWLNEYPVIATFLLLISFQLNP